jgi:HTH-type transcriptional regulator/antitoxin HigA
MNMGLRLIETPEDYVTAIREIDELMSADAGTADGRRLEDLAKLIEEYEAKHFPIDRPSKRADRK